jgi:hypothetical protein
MKTVNDRRNRRLFTVTMIAGVSTLAALGMMSAAPKPVAARKECKVCSMAPPVQISVAETLVTLPVNGQYQFSVDPASGVLANGTWTAIYGTIGQDGSYTCPAFIPPHGLDQLVYTDSNGQHADISVNVVAGNANAQPVPAPIAIVQVGQDPDFHLPGQDTPIASQAASSTSKLFPNSSQPVAWDANLTAYRQRLQV